MDANPIPRASDTTTVEFLFPQNEDEAAFLASLRRLSHPQRAEVVRILRELAYRANGTSAA